MKISFILIAVYLFLFSNLFAQNIGTWKNYTDMENVGKFVVTNDGIWAATDGGLFHWNKKDSSFVKFTKSEGLNNQNLTAIAVDRSGKVWVGTPDGYLDIFNPATNSFNTIMDIHNSDENHKQINDLVTSGDTMLVATDFGLSFINITNFSFYDTILKFGKLPTETKVNSVTKEGLIFISTDRGIAIEKKGAQNLSAPESWNSYSAPLDIQVKSIVKVIKFNNTLIAGTNNGVYLFSKNKWNQFLYRGQFIKDLFAANDTLYTITSDTIYMYANNHSINYFSNNKITFNSIYVKSSKDIYVGTTKGILHLTPKDTSYIFPNGLVSNSVEALAVDTQGRLWTGSGRRADGSGINMFDGKKWVNYNSSNVPAIEMNGFHNIYAAPDGKVYFSNWGRGFTVFNKGQFHTYNAFNTDLSGIVVDTNFVVISDIKTDSKNNVWILNFKSAKAYPLSVLTTNGKWYHFKFGGPFPPAIQIVQHLVIDQYNTKWFAVTIQGDVGLYYFNEEKTFGNTNDDEWGKLTTSDGLNNNAITALAIDKRGELWVGTSLGVNIIANPNNPTSQISSVFAIRQRNITCIAVDPLNRKWIGTSSGLFLMSPDGTQLIAQYNVDNSPLPDNNIKSIAFDNKFGIMYAATDFGISSLTTTAIKPLESFSKLFVYPNPFILKNGIDNRLKIDNLISNTKIKILNIDGKVIKNIITPGGKIAFWNGRDYNNKLVPSGIYIIAAYDEGANNVALTKVAVLRQ